MEYRHKHYGTVIIVTIALGLVLIFALLAFMGDGQSLPIALILILGLALIMFHSLTVEIRDPRLRYHFGPGFIRRTILLSEIDEAKKVQIPWYSGWGIRWIPGQYLLWRV